MGAILRSVVLLAHLVTISTTVASTSSANPKSSTDDLGVTQSYSEAIKWSFGGWEPLSKQLQAQKNASLARQNGLAYTINNNATRAAPHHRVELLSESASSAQNNVHIASQQQQKNSNGPAEANRIKSFYGNEPAHAMRAGRRSPHEFSLPAPAPIVREQLLPQNNQHVQFQQHAGERARPPHHSRFLYPPQPGLHMQPSMNQHQHQAPYQRAPENHPSHAHHHPNRHHLHHHQNHRRGPHQLNEAQRHEQFVREMERRHKQHMMNHQHRHQMMMMRQQQHDQQQRPQMNSMQQPGRQAPAIPFPVRHAMQHVQVAPQNIGTFKVVEGEQPVVFTAEALEHEGRGNERANSSQHHQAAAPYATQSTMATIEKDNLNYNSALQQVSNSLADEQHKSNNIQEVKQRQIGNEHHQSQPQQASQNPRYLTIPVAVETEGDKVLTPNDISEIEKHVINVLPNLSTADKLVKIADTQLDLEHIKNSVEQARKSQQLEQHQPEQQQRHNQIASIMPAELHQMNYEEHRSTMRQLEGMGRPATTPSLANYQQGASSASSSNGTMSTTSGDVTSTRSNQAASSPPAQHEAYTTEQQIGPDDVVEHQFYTAAGPAQELELVDPEQAGEYNLIKNDLLQNIRYEPTRSRPTATGSVQSSHQQTASTPPMPYAGSSHAQSHSSQTSTTMGVPNVTRYFRQGTSNGSSQRPERNNLFNRLNYRQQQQATSSTRAMLGGRKVSEVMRPLMHTTPVPLTSPMHIPSVEPEKIDAIQFIAGSTASDKQPVVVEAHQLVTHTPDGGFDDSSQQSRQQQYAQQQANMSQTYQLVENQHQPQQQQQQFYPQANPNEENQGAIIEYVTISDQALNNALTNQQQSNLNSDSGGQHQQSYEMSSTPEAQPVYIGEQQQHSPQPPLLYAYSSQQQQDQSSTSSYTDQTESPPVQQHSQQSPPIAAWSPSIADENQQQQQQLDLSNQAGPMQQLEFPATAGYNLFGSQQHQDEQQQQQQEPEQDHHSRWRTKAGGRQPNPDAQYDGQIAKADDQEDQKQQEKKSDEQQVQQVMVIDDGQQQQHYATTSANQQQTIETAAPEQRERVNYEQQNQHQPEAVPADTNYQQQQQQQQIEDGSRATFGATSAYVGGAQLNHQTPPSSGNLRYSRPPQSFGQSSSPAEPAGSYAYAELDRNHNQQHLEQQRAEHQAQLTELMTQRQQQQYQTTTPMSVTPIDSRPVDKEARQEQEQQQQQPNGHSDSAALLISQEMPVLDQQSLIQDQDQAGALMSNDDASSKHRHHNQPAPAVFQVYQAYYAPKDHKPLPGYVRLSLDEFNHLFKDAEIQFVDKNLNGLSAANMLGSGGSLEQPQQDPAGTNKQEIDGYEARSNQQDQMRASGSELQSIVVDRRSIADRRSSNSSDSPQPDERRSKDSKPLKQTASSVKKIISIASSRQIANKLVMKRVETRILTTTSEATPRSETKSNATPLFTSTTQTPQNDENNPTSNKSHSQNMPKKRIPMQAGAFDDQKKTPIQKKMKPEDNKKQ